jgi:hypothetical protein
MPMVPTLNRNEKAVNIILSRANQPLAAHHQPAEDTGMVKIGRVKKGGNPKSELSRESLRAATEIRSPRAEGPGVAVAVAVFMVLRKSLVRLGDIRRY